MYIMNEFKVLTYIAQVPFPVTYDYIVYVF